MRNFDSILFRAGSALQAEFVDSDQLGASEWREPWQYDAITCMFAIHYFFVSEAALHRFMENVSINLRDGEDHQHALLLTQESAPVNWPGQKELSACHVA